MGTLELVRLMSFGLFTGTSVVLLYFMFIYVRFVLADTYRHGWWLIAIASGAGMIYGIAGILHVYGNVVAGDLFRKGAALFFILFLSLGIRSIAYIDHTEEEGWSTNFMDYGFDLLVVGLFVTAWWTSFLLWQPTWLVVTHAIGWSLMLLYAFYFGFSAVEQFEGTSIAAVVRDILPVVICFGGVAISEIVSQYTGWWTTFTEAAWIVGIVLVSAFLFNTATTIRQEAAELNRMYDRTTWQEE